ncbi:MAG: indole-3-glycerol-phosphate synthase [Crocinitomicaceae bacterium]|nr:indole-3-glycerol phosphate synthase TrpC [Flavobacteriales bacterium]NQZ34459.1 indole-3-glycerol-phosphate synthase [Crocinitomicaceae bacterium]
MKILDQIIVTKKKEVELLKQKFSYKDFEEAELFSSKTLSLKEKLRSDHFGIIAEIKRKSPSAGLINKDLDVLQQGKVYEAGGAAAISCLTDYFYFGGSNEDLSLLKSAISIPILRKEFIIDEIQLFESKAIGADVILLIAEILTKEQALHLTIMAQSLGMEVIMECHSYNELKKVNDLVDVIGVNNRDLQAQKTTIQTSFDLYNFIPEGKLCISESGIRSKADLIKLSEKGYHGALIGEHILSNSNPADALASLKFKPSQVC